MPEESAGSKEIPSAVGNLGCSRQRLHELQHILAKCSHPWIIPVLHVDLDTNKVHVEIRAYKMNKGQNNFFEIDVGRERAALHTGPLETARLVNVFIFPVCAVLP